MGTQVNDFSQDILQCHLEIHKHLYDVIPIECSVTLLPNDEINKYISCELSVPQIGFGKNDSGSGSTSGSGSGNIDGDIDCTVTLENSNLKDDPISEGSYIDCTVCFDNKKVIIDPKVDPYPVDPRDPEKPVENDISIDCYAGIRKSTLSTDLPCYVSLLSHYQNDGLNCTANISLDRNVTDLNCNALLLYSNLDNDGKNEIDCSANIEYQAIDKTNFENGYDGLLCTAVYEKDQSISDIDCNVTLLRREQDCEFACRIKVPKFRYFYTFPVSINVVKGICSDIYSRLEVINRGVRNIDCTVELDKDSYESDGIDCTANVIPASYADLKIYTELEAINTYRDMDCCAFYTPGIDYDIDSTITVKKPDKVPVKLDEDIPCNMQVGYESRIDINSQIKIVPKIDYSTEFNCSLKINPKARIGILVDPKWSYDPFTLKSSLLTLFDRVYQKVSLSIVYGGNPRSDWDIEHLGYVYKFNLEKVPIINDRLHPDRTRQSIEHFMQHLFQYGKVNKVFIFMDRPLMIRSSIFSKLSDYCSRNNIPLALIDTEGDYYQYNQSNLSNYDYREVNGYDKPIHRIQDNINFVSNTTEKDKDRPTPRIVI